MKNSLKYIRSILSLLLLFSSIGVDAQKYVAKSSVNNSSPELNERIEVSYKLYAKGNSVQLTNPQFQIENNSFKGFKIERHGQAGGGMMFDMGSREGINIFTYKYILKATTLGKQTIPGLTIVFNGKNYKTNPIKINVVKEVIDNSISSNLELRLVPNKKSCYIGETVRYDLYYYSAFDIWKINLSEIPEFNGFIAEFIESDDRAKTKRINGVRYNVQKVGSYLLTPTEAGSLKIPQVSCVMAVSTRRGISQETVKSKIQTFKVKALPPGAPKHFNGLVGEFSISQKTDKKVLPTNDAVTSRFKIKGSGNLASMEDIKIVYPPTFEALPATSSEKIHSNPFGFAGYKSFEFIAIPRQPGRFEIPSVEIPFFNTKTKKYDILRSKPIHIEVTGKGISDLSSNYSPSNKEAVISQGSDIRYLKDEITLLSNEEPMYYTGSFWYFLICILSAMSFIITGLIFKERTYSSEQLKSKNKNKASKVASKRLQGAKDFLNANSDEFYNTLDTAISDYLKDKLMLDQSQMNKEEISNILRDNGIAEQLVGQTIKISEQCKMARFSPLPISKSELFEEATTVINQLENLLK